MSAASKRPAGKTKEEQVKEKKQELEKRLQDVSGQLGNPVPPTKTKTTKKGEGHDVKFSFFFSHPPLEFF